MLTPIECLEKELHSIRVELDFINDTELKREFKEMAEAYEIAIEILGRGEN